MSTEDDVRQTSKHFYAGLNQMANGDAGALTDSWSHNTTVTALHPIGDREIGWDAVRTSFEQVAALSTNGKIELKNQLIRVKGDLAYEIGIEYGSFKLGSEHVHFDQRVTNIYRKEAGKWKMVHHHADLSQPMIDALERVQENPNQYLEPF